MNSAVPGPTLREQLDEALRQKDKGVRAVATLLAIRDFPTPELLTVDSIRDLCTSVLKEITNGSV